MAKAIATNSTKSPRSLHEQLLQKYRKAFRTYARENAREDDVSWEIKRRPQAVVMKIHRPGKEPEPIYAYSHEEIDEKFNEWLASAPSVKSRLEYQRKVAHENLNADISLLAVDQRKIGYAEIVAAVDMAYEQQYAALIRLLKTPPRTMRDVATVAKFMVSADKLGTLPDDAFLMWARTLACAAAFG